TFDPGTGANNGVNVVALQSNGQIMVGGAFSAVSDISRNQIARLNANGSLDTEYDAGTGVNGLVRCAVVQPDGKVIVGGEFTSVNGISRIRVARLYASGFLDPSFNPGSGVTAGTFDPTSVDSVTLQQDGKVIIGGNFS